MSALAARCVVSFANDTPPPSSPPSSPSPLKALGKAGAAQIPVEKAALVPLAPTKLLRERGKAHLVLQSDIGAASELLLAASHSQADTQAISQPRGVIFSPRNDTKLFRSTDTIRPSPSSSSLPPPSIRSYRDENGYLTPPPSSSAGAPGSSSSLGGSPCSTPRLARSILKQRALAAIRVAATVEEGTLNNKEPARLIVSGNRPKPKLTARDSFQLAMLRTAAAEGSGTGKGKGKETVLEEMPASDDSTASDDVPDEAIEADGDAEDSSDDEEEETIEAQGALSTASLVRILLDGAEDLLTLEEAYNELMLRLRANLATPIEPSESVTAGDDHVRIATRPIRDQAPAVVRALIRDLDRLLGRVPHAEQGPDGSSSPFRGLQPLKDEPHTEGRMSSSPTEIDKRAVKRQGYTEAEVRYRREAAGVGQAALKLLAYFMHEQALYSCFSTSDLRSLLDVAMSIPRTPKLPTPNPKKTYYASICIIAQLRIPAEAVSPIQDKIVRAVESALGETLGSMGVSGGTATAGLSIIKKEAYHAATNLLSTYPQIFVHHPTELLPVPLKAMATLQTLHRNKASAVCAAYAAAKISAFALLAANEDDVTNRKEMLDKLKSSMQRSETLVTAQLKSLLKNTQGQVMTTTAGDKKIEANALEQRFKDTIGTAEGVQWACAAWAVVVTLLGSAYATCGLSTMFDHIMNRSLQASNNTTRPLLARAAWAHAIRAYLLASTSYSINSTTGVLETSYKAIQSQELVERLAIIRLPVDLSLDMANAAGSATKVLEPLTDSSKAWFWQRKEKSKKVMWMTTCSAAAASVVYAYTGMAVHHYGAEAAEDEAVLAKGRRLDAVWQDVTKPILSGLFAVKGADKLLTQAWNILLALTADETDAGARSWTLDRLVSSHYLEGRTFGIEAEAAVSDLLLELDAAAISPSDIPACGSAWIVRNIDSVLATFKDMLMSVHGLNDVDNVKWIRMGKSGFVVPAITAQVWTNITVALAQRADMQEQRVAVGKTVRVMMALYALDPAQWLPVALLNEDETLSQDTDTTRLALLSQLLITLIKSFGQEAFVKFRIASETVSADVALSAEIGSNSDAARAIGISTAIAQRQQLEDGMAQDEMAAPQTISPIAAVLHGLLYDRQLSLPPTQRAQLAYQTMLTKVISLCSSHDMEQARSVGEEGWPIMSDVVARLPNLFIGPQDDSAGEAVRMDVWKCAAVAIAHFDYRAAGVVSLAAPDADNGPTIGATAVGSKSAKFDISAMLDLLAFPFRGDVQSFWHINATQGDLVAWVQLLETAVEAENVRAGDDAYGKEMYDGSGLLDRWAGAVGSHMKVDARTSSSTISLACLAQAMSSICVSPTVAPPLEFLAIIGTALRESYPSPESLSAAGIVAATDFELSPSLSDLVAAILPFFQRLSAEHVTAVIDILHSALSTWLADDLRVADNSLAVKLDELYVAVLEAISRSSGAASNVPVSGKLVGSVKDVCELASVDMLHRHIDLFAPRLSRAVSSSVPTAFATFWSTGKYDQADLHAEESVWEFVKDVVDAVPDLIVVKGINDKQQHVLQEEHDEHERNKAEERYPHSLESAQALRAERERLQSQQRAVSQVMNLTRDQTMSKDVEAVVELVPSTAAAALREDEDIAEQILEEEDVDDVVTDEVTPRATNHAVKEVASPAKPVIDEDDLNVHTVSDSYDADVSHSPIVPTRIRDMDDTLDADPVSPGDAEHPNTIDTVDHGDEDSTPAAMPTLATSTGVNDEQGDVFGPEGVVRRKRKAMRRTASGSGHSSSQSQSQSLPRSPAKRARKDLEPERVAAQVDLVPATPTAQVTSQPLDGPGRYATRASAPHSGAHDAPTRSSRTVEDTDQNQSRRRRKLSEIDAMEHDDTVSAPGSQTGKSARGARRWMLERSASTGDIASSTESRSSKRMRRRFKDGRNASATPVHDVVYADVDGEDELLLSPASAKAHREQEEREMREKKGKGKARASDAVPTQTQSTQGKYDNAPDDQTPVSNTQLRRRSSRQSIPTEKAAALVPASRSSGSKMPPAAQAPAHAGSSRPAGPTSSATHMSSHTSTQIPSASPQRSDEQTRLLSMVEEAAKARTVVESMDFDGLLKLMGFVGELRDAATVNLKARVEKSRQGKK